MSPSPNVFIRKLSLTMYDLLVLLESVRHRLRNPRTTRRRITRSCTSSGGYSASTEDSGRNISLVQSPPLVSISDDHGRKLNNIFVVTGMVYVAMGIVFGVCSLFPLNATFLKTPLFSQRCGWFLSPRSSQATPRGRPQRPLVCDT